MILTEAALILLPKFLAQLQILFQSQKCSLRQRSTNGKSKIAPFVIERLKPLQPPAAKSKEKSMNYFLNFSET
jgi:hypothetical protein